MCALAEGNLIPGASSQLEAGSPNYAGRCDGRGVDHGSPAELSRATQLSRPARPVSDQRHFVALLYTLSRDTTLNGATWVIIPCSHRPGGRRQEGAKMRLGLALKAFFRALRDRT